MKKEEMIQLIEMMTKTMEPLMLEANITEGHLLFPAEATVPYFKKAYTWLTKIYETEFVFALQAKALLPQETWDNYKAFGYTDHRETKILKKALFNLRRALIAKSRPTLFKKGEIKKCLSSSRKKV